MPNIFSRIAGALKAKTKNYWTYFGQTIFGEVGFQPTDRDYMDSYEQSYLVYACIRKIAEKVADTTFQLYSVNSRSGKENVKEESRHEVLDLLAQANPYTTKFEMLDLTQTYLELLGNAYWLKVRKTKVNGDMSKNTGKILELWMLRPDRVRVVEDSIKVVAGYEYTLPDGSKQFFPTEDVIHFKQPNPKSSLYGLPTVKPALEIIQSLIFSTRWNKNFFYNDAVPKTTLVLKGDQDEDEANEFRKKWEGQYGGVANAHRLPIIIGDAEFKTVSPSIKDMDFVNLTDTTSQQIMTTFGVPKSILGMQGMNRAEAEAQIFVFLSETVVPKIQRIVERLNQFLLPEFGDNLYLDFVDPTPRDREKELLEYDNALKNNWMVINEVRDKEGLPPVEGGWDIYMPVMTVPVGGLKEGDQKSFTTFQQIKGLIPKDYNKWKLEKEQERLGTKVLAGKRKLKLTMQLAEELRKVLLQNQVKAFTAEQKAYYWREHDKLITADLKLFKTMTKGLFRNQEERIMEALSTQVHSRGFKTAIKKSQYDLIDWETEKSIFAVISSPVYTDIVSRRGAKASKLVGLDVFTITDRIKKFIDRKVFRFSKEVNDTTKELLRSALKEGVGNGEGINELSKRVADVFRERSGYGSERIARTEVISTSNEASLEAYKQSEVVEKKEWLATMDDRVRETHAEMNGEVVGINEAFSNGMMFPGDSADPEESINCRCTTIPVIE